MNDALVRLRPRATVFVLGALLLLVPQRPVRADVPAADRLYQTLLARYVTPRGVLYDVWRSSGDDLKAISEIVMLYRSTDPAPLSPDERKALYINLYNSKVLELVLYGNPRHSIHDLSKHLNSGEIFNRIMFGFDGKPTSLNSLEKKLGDEFKDPRVHFALDCSARSCPLLGTEPYAPTTLDAQLDDAVRRFLAAPDGLQVKTEGGRTTVVASKIFDAYAGDFKASGGVLPFIEKYAPADVAPSLAGGKAKLELAGFDWSLNAAK